MPVSRNYGGFQPSYSSSYYSPTYYTPGSYTSYRSTTSYTPSSSRASTPSRSMISLIPEERKREFRNFGLTPMAAPAAYKYFSRADFYNSTAIYNRSMTSSGYNAPAARKELKTVNTSDLDMEKAVSTRREYAIPGEIKRDTAANIAGGKQVIRLVTTNRKENPYNLVGQTTSQPTEELSMGQRLALKHLLVDPKEKAREEAAKAAEAEAALKAALKEDESSEAESEWTWETCSESEAEDLELDKPQKSETPVVLKPILTAQKSIDKGIDKVYNSTPTPYSSPKTSYTSSATTVTPTAEKKPIPTYPTWMRTTGVSYATPTPTPAVTASPVAQTSTTTTPYRRSSYLDDNATSKSTVTPTQTPAYRRPSCLDDVTSTSSATTPTSTYKRSSYLDDIKSTTTTTPTTTPTSAYKRSSYLDDITSTTTPTPTTTPTSTYRRSSWLEDKATAPVASNVNRITEESSSSSSNSAGSPKFLRRYGGAGSRTLLHLDEKKAGENKADDSSEEGGNFNIGWRRGQPPRSDVVIKLTHDNSAAKITNKILVQNSKPDYSRPLTSIEKKVSFSSPTLPATTAKSATTEPAQTYYTSRTTTTTSPLPQETHPVQFTVAEKPKPVVKEIKLPALKYATDSRAPTMYLMETGVLKKCENASDLATQGVMSLAVAQKCLVVVGLQVTAEDSLPMSVAEAAESSKPRGTIHPDNLSYATRGKKVNLSTCSEVIQADIDEEVFETPTDLDDMKFSAEEIDAVVEHPCLLKETVSMFDKPKIHTMQAVKIEEVRIVKGKVIHHPAAEAVVPEVVELAQHAAIKHAPVHHAVHKHSEAAQAVTKPAVVHQAVTKQAIVNESVATATAPHVKAAVTPAVKIERTATPQVKIEPAVTSTAVKIEHPVLLAPVVEITQADVPPVAVATAATAVKAKKKKADNEVIVTQTDGKQKKKVNKDKAKPKKEKDWQADTPPAPSEYRLTAPTVGTALSTSLPSSTSIPPIISGQGELRKSGSISGKNHKELEEALISTQLDRLPSYFRKVFELKIKGDDYKPERPKDGPLPKYWNNEPKTNEAQINAIHEMAQMKQEVKKHKEKVKKEQEALLKSSEAEPEEVWYKDETYEFQEQLKAYEHMASDHQKNPNDKKTPEENANLIRIYGGVQFPRTPLDITPPHVLRNHEGDAIRCPSEAEEDEAGAFSDTAVSQVQVLGAGGGTRQRRRSVPPSTANIYVNEPPVKTRPVFRKYGINDFCFHRVLGKGSFGKVLLAELRDPSQSFYAVKCLKKDLVLEDDDIECTLIERKVLALGCKHPFICHLFCTFQTESHLFFAMEYLNGGDLMFHIQQSSRFDFDRARFYASEVLLALKFLHKKGIVYRDLKLDNVLLDHEGHIRLADFGMCKLQIYLDRMTDTFCGTPDYMAPEIIKGLKYTYCVDWWSFGVLLYEMLMGQSPFNGCDEDELFWSICNEQPYYPKHLTRETKHLLTLLLDKDPAKRLGVKACISGDICDQPFFKGVNFDLLEKKQIIPPFRPQLRHPMDVSYFESAFTTDEPLLTPGEPEFIETVNQIQFKGFSYTNPNYTLS